MNIAMIKAILAGIAASVLLQMAEAEFAQFVYGCCLDPSGSIPNWYILISSPFQGIVTLVPGFIAGWLSRSNGIVAGLLAGLFGNVVHSTVFQTMWISVLQDGASGVGEMLLRSFVLSSSWALIGAAAGGTAQLLRSNEFMRPICEDARVG
jgi:hypothetical protein